MPGREVLFTYLQAPLVALLRRVCPDRTPGFCPGRHLARAGHLGLRPGAAHGAAASCGVDRGGLVAFSYLRTCTSPLRHPRRALPAGRDRGHWAWWRTVAQVTPADGARTSAGIRHPTEVAPHARSPRAGLLCASGRARVVRRAPARRAVGMPGGAGTGARSWRWRPRRHRRRGRAAADGLVVATPGHVHRSRRRGVDPRPEPGAVAVNAAKVAGMFNVAGASRGLAQPDRAAGHAGPAGAGRHRPVRPGAGAARSPGVHPLTGSASWAAWL